MPKKVTRTYLRMITGEMLSVRLIPEYANTNKLNSRTCLNSNLEILMTLENLWTSQNPETKAAATQPIEILNTKLRGGISLNK